MGWGSPRFTLQGGCRELSTAKRAKGDRAEGDVCSVPGGTPRHCCCRASRLPREREAFAPGSLSTRCEGTAGLHASLLEGHCGTSRC